MPLDVGIIVNNSETLFNIYNALFLGKPVTTKFLSVYGEDIADLKVYEVPIGASMTEVLEIAGLDVAELGSPLGHRWRTVPERDGHRGTRDRGRLGPPDDERPVVHPQGHEE